ncbi:MAG: ATP-binding cassette domain-containing protein, partial [Mycobacteriaceae bacterium]
VTSTDSSPKSTLLGLASSMLDPRSGFVSIGRGERKIDTRKARALIGWMPQRINAITGMRCREQVAYHGWLMGLSRSTAWDEALGSLDRVGLSGKASTATTSLSGGQLRRLGLAQALVFNPSVLLLDEPTAGLDPSQKARFRKIIDQIESAEILISTHEVSDLSEVYDSVAVLNNGQLVFDGTTESFLRLSPAGSHRPAEDAYSRLVGDEI